MNTRGMLAVGLFLCAVGPVSAQEPSDVELARRLGRAFSTVAEEASPAVVSVRVETKSGQRFTGKGSKEFDWRHDLDEFFERWLPEQLRPRRGDAQEPPHASQGTGFIVSAEGTVVTTSHLIRDADRITVRLHDGRLLDAKLVGSDPRTDVAVIKVSAVDLPVLEFGDSNELRVGEWVIAVGNPFGLTESVTVGVVSGKGRGRPGITDSEDFIQTDAAINPGNSGGPLLNLTGQAVGMNTAILNRNGGYQGIGFAIPSNMLETIVAELIDHGRVARGYLGVRIQELTPELAESLGAEGRRGVLVTEVGSETPAEKAGLRLGDIVVRVNGRPVEGVEQLKSAVGLTVPGERVMLQIVRKGKARTISATVGSKPRSEEPEAEPQPEEEEGFEEFGLWLRELTPALAARLGYEVGDGVVVSRVDPDGLAAVAGLRPGDLITQVNLEPVRSCRDVRRIQEESASRLVLLVKDGRSAKFVLLHYQSN